MAKDFAVQGYKKEKSGNKLNLVIAIFTVIVVTSFYFLKIKPHSTKKVNNHVSSKQVVEATNQEIQQPRFEFYSMLPDSNKNDTLTNENILYGKFILRLGEFKYKAEAVKLQKRLKTKNHDANINIIEVKNKKYYLVSMGPYSSNIEANKIKVQLKNDRYKSTIQHLEDQ